MFKTLIKCMDLYSLPLGIAGVLAGTAASDLSGNFEFFPASLCLLFVLFFMPAANMAHRYFDLKYSYGKSLNAYIDYNEIDMEVPLVTLLREGTLAALILSGIVGMSLMAMGGAWMLGIGILLLLLMYLGSSGPKPISNTPANYILAFFVFGPLTVLTTFLVQFLHFNQRPITNLLIIIAVLVSVTIGLLSANALIVYNYRNIDHDKHVGIRSIATCLGRRGTKIFFFSTGLIATVCSIIAESISGFPYYGALCVAPIICFVINSYITFRLDTADHQAYWRLRIWANCNPLIFALISFLICAFLPINPRCEYLIVL